MRYDRYVICLALGMPLAAIAQTVPPQVSSEAERSIFGATLWRSLKAGQTVQQASDLLASYEEVKSVKAKVGKKGKAPSLSLVMKPGGISIYGSSFSISTTFDLNAHLQEVTLISEAECANEAVEKSDRIFSALSDKYGDEASGKRSLDSLDLSSALVNSYRSEKNETITYGFMTKEVAVVFVVAAKKDKRPEYYGGGSLARSLAQIAIGIYDAQKEKCSNSGDEMVVYAIKYLSRLDFDTRMHNIESEKRAEDAEARRSF